MKRLNRCSSIYDIFSFRRLTLALYGKSVHLVGSSVIFSHSYQTRCYLWSISTHYFLSSLQHRFEFENHVKRSKKSINLNEDICEYILKIFVYILSVIVFVLVSGLVLVKKKTHSIYKYICFASS